MTETVVVAAPGWALTLGLLALAYALGRGSGAREERSRARISPSKLDAGLVIAALAAAEAAREPGGGPISRGEGPTPRVGGDARTAGKSRTGADCDAPRQEVPSGGHNGA